VCVPPHRYETSYTVNIIPLGGGGGGWSHEGNKTKTLRLKDIESGHGRGLGSTPRQTAWLCASRNVTVTPGKYDELCRKLQSAAYR
jgi:hypothetical protein